MAYRKRLAACVLAPLLLAGPAWSASDRLQAAQAALAAGDYRKAYAAYLAEAPRSALARFTLGSFLREGWGRAPDPVAACRWFEQSAQAVPAAAHYWGDCLVQGIGRAPDPVRALASYEHAAQGGHLISLCSAADLHIRGRGVPQDAARGLALCAQAAQANSPPAMLRLGDYYYQGDAVPGDLAQARQWYAQAAGMGVAEGQFKLGVMLAQGEGGAPDLDAARYLLESAASAGYQPAYLPTAQLYGNAPVQAGTGALAPEHLAKIYLWSAAAEARAPDSTQRAAAHDILTQVLAVMPASWRPTLDQQVAAHLSQYAPALPHTRSK